MIEQLVRRHDAYKVFAAFTHLTACALAHGTREPEYLDEAKRWERHELEILSHALGALVMEMEAQPFTDLGGHYMDLALSHKGQQWNGEFHTPQPICELMARMIAGDTPPPDEAPITLCEPACGAGAMILAYAQALPADARRRLRVTAIDISKVACDISEAARSSNMEVVIPPRRNRKQPRQYDHCLYELRHLVENAFMKLKGWRAIATRYAKRTSSFLAAVHIRCALLWANIS